MEVSDLQEHCRSILTDPFPEEKVKSVVESLFDEEKILEALHIYTCAFSLDFQTKECLEVLLEAVTKKARKILIKTKKLNLDSFICSKCYDIIKDPITLKCGHTFSKKCTLLKVKTDSFTCPCGETYSSVYISQLKNNVAILSLVDRFYERNLSKFNKRMMPASCQIAHDKIHGSETYFKCKCDDGVVCGINPYASNLRPCTTVVDYKEALKYYVVSYAVEPNCIFSKERSLEVLHRIFNSNLFPASQNRKRHPVGSLRFGHSDNPFRNLGSSDSLHVAEDELSSSDEEDTIMMSSEFVNLLEIFNGFLDYVKKAAGARSFRARIDKRDLPRDIKDFECPLCMRLLWEPVTTTCGHTFCRVCLNRWFDHQPNCPLCKTSLTVFLAERVQNTTEFVELAIENLFPRDFARRKAIYLEELEELSKAGKDPEHEIPLFVCTVALPTVPCPLHVFEPRYRLMIRQCMESGNRQFGMCGVVDDEIAEYGTMLEIRDVKYFPDGRSIVDTIGQRRFRILRRGERDGYHTGAVEFLKDRPLSDLDRQSIEEKHNRTYKESRIWFRRLPYETKLQILQHFGPMPLVETDYLSSPNGPSWSWWLLAILPVETKLKVLVISLTSLPQRLEMLYRILLHFQSDIET